MVSTAMMMMMMMTMNMVIMLMVITVMMVMMIMLMMMMVMMMMMSKTRRTGLFFWGFNRLEVSGSFLEFLALQQAAYKMQQSIRRHNRSEPRCPRVTATIVVFG